MSVFAADLLAIYSHINKKTVVHKKIQIVYCEVLWFRL